MASQGTDPTPPPEAGGSSPGSSPEAGDGGPGPETGQRPGYEQARDELGEIVRALESGAGGLAESLLLWERGEYLVGVCQSWLDGARERVERARGEHHGRSPDAD